MPVICSKVRKLFFQNKNSLFKVLTTWHFTEKLDLNQAQSVKQFVSELKKCQKCNWFYSKIPTGGCKWNFGYQYLQCIIFSSKEYQILSAKFISLYTCILFQSYHNVCKLNHFFPKRNVLSVYQRISCLLAISLKHAFTIRNRQFQA